MHRDYGKPYVALLKSKVAPSLKGSQCLDRTILMQNGTRSRIATCVKNLLSRHLIEYHVISRHLRPIWPTRSLYLNPCNFFFL